MLDYAVTLLKNPVRPNDPRRAYAFLQSRATLDINEIADHMVSHGCTYDRGDIIAIIVKLVSCSKELMLDGYRLRLGDMGKLYLSCSSEGAASKEDFTRANIKQINVKFKPSEQFSGLVQNASLHRVPTRKAAAAALAAEVAGLTSADWTSEEGGE